MPGRFDSASLAVLLTSAHVEIVTRINPPQKTCRYHGPAVAPAASSTALPVMRAEGFPPRIAYFPDRSDVMAKKYRVTIVGHRD